MTKKKQSLFSLDENVVLALHEYSIESMITKSKLVNKLLKDFLIKEKKIRQDDIR